MMVHGRDDNGIIKGGFLWKHRRGTFRKWKPYYLVLSRPCLLFFKSEDHMRDGKQPKLKVELYDISYVELVERKHGNSKKLVVGYETLHDQSFLYLKGHDVSDARSWKEKIEDAVSFCKMRKDVHCELKTASFKREVEQNVRQRVVGCNPHMRSKQIPEVTYLRRIASCEFKGQTLTKTDSGCAPLAAQRSQSMDDNLSLRSNDNDWRFSSSLPSGSSKWSENKVGRSNSTAVTPSGYSRAFLDGVRREEFGSNNNLNSKSAAITNTKVSRHSSMLTAVPEDRITRTGSEFTRREQRSQGGCNPPKPEYQSEPHSRADTDFRRHLRSTGSDIYSRDRRTSGATQYSKETAYVQPYKTNDSKSQQDCRTAGFRQTSEVDYSNSGRVSAYQGVANQRGQPKYQSFHGGLQKPESHFDRNTPAYSSFHTPIKSPYIGETRGMTGNKYQNSYNGYRSTSNSVQPSPFKEKYQPYSSKKYAGYDIYNSQNQNRLTSAGYLGNRYQGNKISPPGSVSSFGDPRYRIDEGRVWTEKSSDAWSDIDSGFIEERF